MNINLDFDECQDAFDGEDLLQLCVEPMQLIIDGISLNIEKIPVLKNMRLNKVFFPDNSKNLIKYAINIAKQDKSTSLNLGDATQALELNSERYNFCEKLNFLYSALDYNFIPGLWRPFNKGFLTPVFFNLSTLDKYSRHPSYTLNLFSETYGSIITKDWMISFGINSKKQVMLWLGDIAKLPIEEQYYLRSENVSSEHDFHSEFYNAQIETQWSSPSERNKLFKLRYALQEAINNKYHFSLFHLDLEVGKLISDLDIPVYWEDKHISPIINSLNQIFVESLNKSIIENILKTKLSVSSDDLKQKGSLKIIGIWLERQLNMTKEEVDSILCSFYVLYDFRVVVCHTCSEEKRREKLQSIKERLSLSVDSDNEALYTALIRSLAKSFSDLLGKV